MNGHLPTAHSPKMCLGAVAKVAGIHVGHGVVEKKQSGLGNKVCFAMSMELLLRIVVV